MCNFNLLINRWTVLIRQIFYGQQLSEQNLMIIQALYENI